MRGGGCLHVALLLLLLQLALAISPTTAKKAKSRSRDVKMIKVAGGLAVLGGDPLSGAPGTARYGSLSR